MSQLIYTSSETRPFSPSDLERLLERARARNRAVGLTGMMIYHAGVFLQALEGGEYAVGEIFSRIENDRRHRDICVLHRNALLLGPRVFGEEPMGFADADGAADILCGFIEMQKSLSTLDRTAAIEVLEACGRAARKQIA